MSEKIKLLPCPFCGGEAEIIMEPGGTAWGADGYFVKCHPCQIRTGMAESPEGAAIYYNRRDPQPVAVIVPPLEWGEWDTYVNTIAMRFCVSKCGGYKIEHDVVVGTFIALDITPNRLRFLLQGTWSEAIAACQAHKQAAVDKVIEGCNVVPWRDPQPLLDAIKTAKPKIIELLKHFGTMDAERDPLTELDAVTKAWEAGA